MIILNEFINNLKITMVFITKQICVIDFISIYVNDSNVYKDIIVVNLLMIKKAKKLGKNKQYTTMFFNDIAVDLNKLKKKCSNGKFMTMKC